uniref:Cysteine protease n=1 Tax=Lotharella globosa TaxID=91324 RepID=A0A7S4DGX0_9EUKA
MWEAVFGDQESDAKKVFSRAAPVCLLGVEYNVHESLKKHLKSGSMLGPSKLREMLIQEMERRKKKVEEDFRSRVWFSYREGFPEITPTQWTSDAGWGCMLRTSQMMFCQALITHNLGRGWRLNRSRERSALYSVILRWFLDYPCKECPYSLHNLLHHADCVGKKVGEWFGPQAACVVIQRCHATHKKSPQQQPMLPTVHMASDGTLYLDQLVELCAEKKRSPSTSCQQQKPEKQKVENVEPETTKMCEETPGSATEEHQAQGHTLETKKSWQQIVKESADSWRPVVILVPVRLGLDSINPNYCEGLRRCLKLPQSLGFVGGRPRSSLYFIGYQVDWLDWRSDC